MTLEDARKHVGATVTYRPLGRPAETGTITSVSQAYVFVRFAGSRTGVACYASDLRLHGADETGRLL